MPRIPNTVRDCVFYVYADLKRAKDGERAGGSGFLVGVRSSILQSRFYVYAVTNSHVINWCGDSPVIRINSENNRMDFLETEGTKWHSAREDDLAVYPLSKEPSLFFYTFVSDEMFLTKEAVKEFDIGPGNDVFFIGRFVNHEGKQQNWPALRFGNISMMPWEPIERDDGSWQESFVVEGRSIGGYSGAPVFVHIPPGPSRLGIAIHATDDGGGIVGFTPAGPKGEFKKDDWPQEFIPTWLLGVDWGHIPIRSDIVYAEGWRVREDLKVKSNSGMSGIVPAWKLRDLLYTDELVQAREKGEKELRKDLEAAGVLDDLPGR